MEAGEGGGAVGASCTGYNTNTLGACTWYCGTGILLYGMVAAQYESESEDLRKKGEGGDQKK